MRRKNLLKELGIQKQADISCNALDIDTENVRPTHSVRQPPHRSQNIQDQEDFLHGYSVCHRQDSASDS